MFTYIGKSINATAIYYIIEGLYALIGLFCMEHFDKFVGALAEFHGAFNQWIKEIFKLDDENGTENGNDGENPKK